MIVVGLALCALSAAPVVVDERDVRANDGVDVDGSVDEKPHQKPLSLQQGDGSAESAAAEANHDDDDDDVDDDDEPKLVTGSVRLSFDGRLGVSVGNVLLVPFVTPGPGGASGLSAQMRFFDHITLGADLGASFGLQFQNADPAPLVGYRGRLQLGITGDVVDSVSLAGALRLGVSSFALIPLPRYGLAGTVTWRPVDAGWFVWDVRGELDAELLVIAPAPGLGLSTGTTLRFGAIEGGFRAGVEGDAVVAVVVNTAGAAVFVEGFIGARF